MGFQYNACGPRQVYSPEERASYARRARQLLNTAGMTVPGAAEKLGLNPTTLYNWLRQPAPGRFLPVAVLAEATEIVAASELATNCQPVVVAPGGYRVEGLDLEGVAVLLRRLA
ncbi:MAG: helix-turn-helix domain-containing protein [Candidatus Sericytochromatia bacterium]|nr:helix-turn-helix domain-containing protein [Candidatus Sericytochromatia bacterium]